VKEAENSAAAIAALSHVHTHRFVGWQNILYAEFFLAVNQTFCDFLR